MPRRLALTALLLLVALFGVGCDMLNPDASATPVEEATATPHPSPSATSATPAIVGSPALTKATDRLLFGENGVYGVVMMRSDGAFLYSRNCTTPFITASLYKLVLLANIYQLREDGEIRFDQVVTLQSEYFPDETEPADSYFDVSAIGGADTVDDLVFATGAYSSNVAARALLDLTTHKALNATAKDLGMVDTHFFVEPATLQDWPPTPSVNTRAADTESAMRFAAQSTTDGPINLTTPCDIARYFLLLERGQVVDQQASTEIFDILSQQAVDNRFPVLLPPGTAMAHKTGNLDNVVHDVGIIYHDDQPVILVAMSEAMTDEERSTAIIQRLALIAYGTNDVPPLPASPGTPATNTP